MRWLHYNTRFFPLREKRRLEAYSKKNRGQGERIVVDRLVGEALLEGLAIVFERYGVPPLDPRRCLPVVEHDSGKAGGREEEDAL